MLALRAARYGLRVSGSSTVKQTLRISWAVLPRVAISYRGLPATSPRTARQASVNVANAGPVTPELEVPGSPYSESSGTAIPFEVCIAGVRAAQCPDDLASHLRGRVGAPPLAERLDQQQSTAALGVLVRLGQSR